MLHWLMAIGLDLRLESMAVVLTPIFYWGFFAWIGMPFGDVFLAVLTSLVALTIGGFMLGAASMFVWEKILQFPVKRPGDTFIFIIVGYVASILICMVMTAHGHLKDKREKAAASGES